MAFLLLAVSLSGTVFVGIGSLVAGASKTRSTTGVYGKVYRFLSYDALRPDMDCSPTLVK